jgi:hypothetical protein
MHKDKADGILFLGRAARNGSAMPKKGTLALVSAYGACTPSIAVKMPPFFRHQRGIPNLGEMSIF